VTARGPGLARLGWFVHHDELPPENSDSATSRVVVEHRGAYELWGPHGRFEAAVEGSFRDRAADGRDFPTVGDWVRHSLDPRHDRRVVITTVEDRSSAVVRRAAGHAPVPQVVAANVDVVCIVTTAGEDLSLRRIERYLVAAMGSRARPLIAVNKTDLGGPLPELGSVAGDVEVVGTSTVSGEGLDRLRRELAGDATIAFIGSSGVGKSSLVNALVGTEHLDIGAVRADGRGRHTTVRRQLLLVPTGGVVIDTPGLREVRLWDDEGLPGAFPDIGVHAPSCRFGDCSHQTEPDCAVVAAVERGDLPADRLVAYRELRAELADLLAEREQYERLARQRRDRGRPRGRATPRRSDEEISDR